MFRQGAGSISHTELDNQACIQLHWCLDFAGNMVAENNLDRYCGASEVVLAHFAMRRNLAIARLSVSSAELEVQVR